MCVYQIILIYASNEEHMSCFKIPPSHTTKNALGSKYNLGRNVTTVRMSQVAIKQLLHALQPVTQDIRYEVQQRGSKKFLYVD